MNTIETDILYGPAPSAPDPVHGDTPRDEQARTLYDVEPEPLRRARAESAQRWADETRQALGADFDRHVSRAQDIIDRFGDPELSELFERTGAGGHKSMVLLLSRLAERLR